MASSKKTFNFSANQKIGFRIPGDGIIEWEWSSDGGVCGLPRLHSEKFARANTQRDVIEDLHVYRSAYRLPGTTVPYANPNVISYTRDLVMKS